MSYLILSTRLRRKIDYAINILDFIESIKLRDGIRQVLLKLKEELVKFSNLLAKKAHPLTEDKIKTAWEILKKSFSTQWQEMLEQEDLREIIKTLVQANGLQINWLKMIEDEIKAVFQSKPELRVEELREIAKQRLLEYELVEFGESIKPLFPVKPPSCFITYAWGNKEHEEEVHQVAYLLKRAGIDVLLDIWCNKVNSVPVFTELVSKEKSDFVLVVGTHLLKHKNNVEVTDRGSWVHEELQQIGMRKQKYPNDHGIIKLLLQAPSEQSFPEFLSPLAHDYTDFDLKQNYYEKFFNVLELLYEKYPLVKDKLIKLRQVFEKEIKVINRLEEKELTSILQLNNLAEYENQTAKKEAIVTKIKQASRLFSEFVEREFANELLYAEILKSRLQSKYAENDKIKRLFYSDNPLPIASCYLHLALVQDKEVKKHKEEVRDKSNEKTFEQRDYLLHEYERIDHIQQKLEVHEILKECKTATKRIFIEGAAGAGKSTLCQRIAYDWSRGKEPWKDYKWLFHIRLRDLRNTSQDTKDYLRTIIINCFQHGHAPFHKWQVKKIISEMQSITNKPKVLFLLDGYDELHLDPDTLKKLLEPLKDYDFIVTSRPGSNFRADVANHHVDTKQLLHLVVLGFNEQQIKQYITQFFDPSYPSDAKAEEAKACLKWLQNNPNLWSLAHIPIQLELLCSIWGDELKIQTTITLTSLYELILEKLLVRLEVERQNKEMGDIVSDHLKESAYNQHLTYLNYLAYLGMKDGKIVLEQKKHIEKALKDLKIKEEPKTFFKTLRDLGLFRRSHDGKQGDFIHLTFQEFLAAKHWAQLFSEQSTQKEATQWFIDNRDKPQYQVMWWFVSGLLKHDLFVLKKFFAILLGEGAQQNKLLAKPSQLMLSLRCLEESAQNDKVPIIKYFAWLISLFNRYLKKVLLSELNKLRGTLLTVFSEEYYHLVSIIKMSPVLIKKLDIDRLLLREMEKESKMDKYYISLIVHNLGNKNMTVINKLKELFLNDLAEQKDICLFNSFFHDKFYYSLALKLISWGEDKTKIIEILVKNLSAENFDIRHRSGDTIIKLKENKLIQFDEKEIVDAYIAKRGSLDSIAKELAKKFGLELKEEFKDTGDRVEQSEKKTLPTQFFQSADNQMTRKQEQLQKNNMQVSSVPASAAAIPLNDDEVNPIANSFRCQIL